MNIFIPILLLSIPFAFSARNTDKTVKAFNRAKSHTVNLLASTASAFGQEKIPADINGRAFTATLHQVKQRNNSFAVIDKGDVLQRTRRGGDLREAFIATANSALEDLTNKGIQNTRFINDITHTLIQKGENPVDKLTETSNKGFFLEDDGTEGNRDDVLIHGTLVGLGMKDKKPSFLNFSESGSSFATPIKTNTASPRGRKPCSIFYNGQKQDEDLGVLAIHRPLNEEKKLNVLRQANAHMDRNSTSDFDQLIKDPEQLSDAYAWAGLENPSQVIQSNNLSRSSSQEYLNTAVITENDLIDQVALTESKKSFIDDDQRRDCLAQENEVLLQQGIAASLKNNLDNPERRDGMNDYYDTYKPEGCK